MMYNFDTKHNSIAAALIIECVAKMFSVSWLDEFCIELKRRLTEDEGISDGIAEQLISIWKRAISIRQQHYHER